MKRFYSVLFCFISVLVTQSAFAVEATSFRGVCRSNTQITKYYQQGIEVWGSEVFWSGEPLEEWINEQDSATGGTGGYTCHIEKAPPLDPKFIAAIKKL
ncbi:hypothetical protein L8P30_09865 [Enterobacter asburiae]|uniref:hypothetical protein n=1 Tax=Enterobacter asburiae TaxID=61645 RepID=UPI002003B6BB|nr:hypothetical protein [Enterobacter asburiae]MCK7142556.1 hypothetical protein [Enterobacter asburiae]